MLPFTDEQLLLNRTPLDNQQILSGQFWGELRVFLAVAKAKSFNRAADMLHTSQPTVSRQVKRLQDLMGSQLFVSTQHGVQLTRKGDELAKALSQLDLALFSLTNDLKSETQQAAGVVRVSITDGLNAAFVAPALADFSAGFPKIQMHLKSTMNVMSLRDNQTDLMLGFHPTSAADISIRKLGHLHFIPIASKGYIHKYGLPKRNTLDKHRFLQSEFYLANTGLWEPWSSAVGKGRVAHYCDNTFAYGALVKAGLGIGLLGSYIVLEPSAVPLQLGVKISVPMYLMALTERLQSRPVRVAFDWLTDIFGNTNPWFNEKFRVDNPPSPYDDGFKLLFNL
jgi:DNA-binding transcriptional LysR family regulator